VEPQDNEIKGHAEKTMGENGHLLSQLEQAGKLHGHICPSLFYGVSLAMRIREWKQASSNHANRAACSADNSATSGAACEIILEGKSQCIRDGVRSVLGENTPFTVQSTGQCALSVVCADQQCCPDQPRYRLSISQAVRNRINEFNQSLPLEEFKRVGVAYLKSLSPRELFGE
jgi:hypothetical protein